MERIDIPQFQMSNQRVIGVKESYIEIHDDHLRFFQDYLIESREDPDNEYGEWVEKKIYNRAVIKKDKIQDIYFYYDGNEYNTEGNKHPYFSLRIATSSESKLAFKKLPEVKSLYDKLIYWWLY